MPLTERPQPSLASSAACSDMRLPVSPEVAAIESACQRAVDGRRGGRDEPSGRVSTAPPPASRLTSHANDTAAAEKGSDRDPIGGALGDRRRLAECRNPVWCEQQGQNADAAVARACVTPEVCECDADPTAADSQVCGVVLCDCDDDSEDTLSVLSENTLSVAISRSSSQSEAPDETPHTDIDARLVFDELKSLEDRGSQLSIAGPSGSADPSCSQSEVGATSQLELIPNSDDSDDDEALSLSGGVSRFLRNSMRKMWHFRLSSRGLRRRSSASQHQGQSDAAYTPRLASETRAARLAARDAASPHRAEAEVCCRPDGNDVRPGLDSVGGVQTQQVFMSTLLDRLNGSASSSGSSSSSSSSQPGQQDDAILVSTREPRLHDAPLPALAETSVAFDTPPPPLSSEAEPRAGAVVGGRGARLLSRGSSFLGVYQAVPELSSEEEARRGARGHWQHSYSSPLACLTCTLGLGAICRFALFGGIYGVAFFIQFGILSLLVGMPLMTLHMTLGQYIGAGIVDMWRISPIFKGIGLAAALAELILGVYTVVPITWMLVYLRDSFVSSYDRYKWAACPAGNCSFSYAELITYSVPQYFNERVLNRDMASPESPEVGRLGFEISFNLAVVWILVYLSLGRGIRSYGKVVYAFVALAILSFLTVCIHLLSWADGVGEFFTDKVLFDNVFWSTVPWVVAARETFLIWGLHGAAIMAITSHNKFSHSLRRDTSFVALVTMVMLFFAALFGYACLHTLRTGDVGYTLGASSFAETEQQSRFLIAPGIGSSHSGGPPPEVKHYTNLVSGVIIRQAGSEDVQGTQWRSGYQVHRLCTEIFPSLLAVVGGNGISSFWALVFYLSALLFGVGQQLAVWRCVVEAAVSLCPRKLRSWELTATFVLCVAGFALSLPMMTSVGIHVIFFLDYCVGCLWWLVVIYVLELFAVFYMRGSPFASTQVVTILIAKSSCMTNWAGPFLSFVWHVILPMAMLVLSVVSFRTGDFDSIFTWEEGAGYGVWGLWVRQLGSMLMMFPILLVPVVGLVQAIRFVKNGSGDLYDRVQSLYRPEYSETILGRISVEQERAQMAQRRQERLSYTDPPPKYTPPPSYSTATGSRLAKMLRQSMRRSMRRIPEAASVSGAVTAPSAGAAGRGDSDPSRVTTASRRVIPSDPPPSYASILLESFPSALRRSIRRIRASVRRNTDDVNDLSLVTSEQPPGSEEPGAMPAAVRHHQRSFSLGLVRHDDAQLGDASSSNTLPRRLTAAQVKQALHSGRLSLPASAEPAPPPAGGPPADLTHTSTDSERKSSECSEKRRPELCADHIRQVLRGGSRSRLVRAGSLAGDVCRDRTTEVGHGSAQEQAPATDPALPPV